MVWCVIFIAWTFFTVALGDYSVLVGTANFTAVIDYQTKRISEAELYCKQVYKADLARIENLGELAKLSSALVEKRKVYGSSHKTGGFMIDGRTQVKAFSPVELSSIVYGSNITDKDTNCITFHSWSHQEDDVHYYEANAYITESHPCEVTWSRSFLCRKKSTRDPAKAVPLRDYSFIISTFNYTAVMTYQTRLINDARLYCSQVYSSDLARIDSFAELTLLSTELVKKREIYGEGYATGQFMIEGRARAKEYNRVEFSNIEYGQNISGEEYKCLMLDSWSRTDGVLHYFESDVYGITALPCSKDSKSFLCKKSLTGTKTDVGMQSQEEVWVLAVTAVAGVVFGSILTGIIIYSVLKFKGVRNEETREEIAIRPIPEYEVPNIANNDVNSNYTSLHY